MVMFAAGLLASLTLLQPAAATFNWGLAQPYQNPLINDNVCSDVQKGGFDWKDLAPGKVSKFDDFDFSGFEAKDNFEGRAGSKKCIEGKATKDKGACPKFSVGADKNFSIKEMEITVEFDADIEFVFDMPDGSVCKQTQKCSAGGSKIPNKQCGGSKSVTFQSPKNGKDCRIGIHRVDFDCDKGVPSPPPPPPPSTSSTVTTSSRSSTTVPPSTSSTVSTSSRSTTTAPPNTSSTVSTSSRSSTTVPPSTSTSVTTSTSKSSTSLPLTSSTATTGSQTTSTSSTPPSSIPNTLTSTTPTTPPGTPPPSTSTSSVSTTNSPPPSTSQITTSSTAIPPPPPTTLQTVTSSTAIPPPPPPPEQDAPCPPTLPRCLNTWLSITSCKSNSDVECMCTNSEYTKSVISCVSAWSNSDAETQAALSYFAGICAPFIPQNPGICTDVPDTITLIPTITATIPPQQTAPTQGGGKGGEPPCTTVTFTNIVTGITVTNTITVPLVTFVTGAETIPVVGPTATVTAQAVASVGLVPASVPLPTATASFAVATQTATATATATVGGGSGGGRGPVATTTAGPDQPRVSTFTGDASRGMLVGDVASRAGLMGLVALMGALVV